jgi:hypothetical protein
LFSLSCSHRLALTSLHGAAGPPRIIQGWPSSAVVGIVYHYMALLGGGAVLATYRDPVTRKEVKGLSVLKRSD